MDLEVEGQLQPTSSNKYRALYLFAGVEREADLASAAVIVLLEQDPEAEIEFENVDILRGGEAHNLLKGARQEEYLRRLEKGYYDALMTAAPCNTHSRALYFDDNGPPPCRNLQFPWGYPNLSGSDKTRIEDANSLIRFSLLALKAALTCTSKVVFVLGEFPEDLGDCRGQSPASLWQLPETHEVVGLGPSEEPSTNARFRQ